MHRALTRGFSGLLVLIILFTTGITTIPVVAADPTLNIIWEHPGVFKSKNGIWQVPPEALTTENKIVWDSSGTGLDPITKLRYEAYTSNMDLIFEQEWTFLTPQSSAELMNPVAKDMTELERLYVINLNAYNEAGTRIWTKSIRAEKTFVDDFPDITVYPYGYGNPSKSYTLGDVIKEGEFIIDEFSDTDIYDGNMRFRVSAGRGWEVEIQMVVNGVGQRFWQTSDEQAAQGFSYDFSRIMLPDAKNETIKIIYTYVNSPAGGPERFGTKTMVYGVLGSRRDPDCRIEIFDPELGPTGAIPEQSLVGSSPPTTIKVSERFAFLGEQLLFAPLEGKTIELLGGDFGGAPLTKRADGNWYVKLYDAETHTNMPCTLNVKYGDGTLGTITYRITLELEKGHPIYIHEVQNKAGVKLPTPEIIMTPADISAAYQGKRPPMSFTVVTSVNDVEPAIELDGLVYTLAKWEASDRLLVTREDYLNDKKYWTFTFPGSTNGNEFELAFSETELVHVSFLGADNTAVVSNIQAAPPDKMVILDKGSYRFKDANADSIVEINISGSWKPTRPPMLISRRDSTFVDFDPKISGYRVNLTGYDGNKAGFLGDLLGESNPITPLFQVLSEVKVACEMVSDEYTWSTMSVEGRADHPYAVIRDVDGDGFARIKLTSNQAGISHGGVTSNPLFMELPVEYENRTLYVIDEFSDRIPVCTYVFVKAGEVDKTALVAILREIGKLSSQDFTKVSWNALSPVVTKGNNVLASSTATQVQINDMVTELVNGRNALINVKLLKQAIADVDAWLKLNKDKQEMYSAESWTNLTTVLEEERANIESHLTKSTVDTSYYRIQTLWLELRNSNIVNPTDRTALLAILNLSRPITNESNKYTALTYAPFATSRTNGQQVYDDDLATQLQIDTATNDLTTKYHALELRPVDPGDSSSSESSSSSSESSSSDSSSSSSDSSSSDSSSSDSSSSSSDSSSSGSSSDPTPEDPEPNPKPQPTSALLSFDNPAYSYGYVASTPVFPFVTKAGITVSLTGYTIDPSVDKIELIDEKGLATFTQRSTIAPDTATVLLSDTQDSELSFLAEMAFTEPNVYNSRFKVVLNGKSITTTPIKLYIQDDQGINKPTDPEPDTPEVDNTDPYLWDTNELIGFVTNTKATDTIEVPVDYKYKVSSNFFNFFKTVKSTVAFTDRYQGYTVLVKGSNVSRIMAKEEIYDFRLTTSQDWFHNDGLGRVLDKKYELLEFNLYSPNFKAQVGIKTEMRRKDVFVYNVIDDKTCEFLTKVKSTSSGLVEFSTSDFGNILLTTTRIPNKYLLNPEDLKDYLADNTTSDETTAPKPGESTTTRPVNPATGGATSAFVSTRASSDVGKFIMVLSLISIGVCVAGLVAASFFLQNRRNR